jgi:2-oxoisovalerate dehydrogenase E1 component
VKYFNADSNDIDQLDSQTKLAIGAARRDDCPVMLHVNTYRLNSHSKGDDNRSEIEINKEAEKDLLNRFKETCPDLYNATYSAAIIKITQFVKEIMNEPKLESCESMADIPYFIDSESSWAPIDCESASVRYNEEIHLAISNCFETHKSVLIGEDIEHKTPYTNVPYGGAFKVSRDLSERYPEAVKNTPISEAAIVGIGTGLAIKGIKSFVEIMFGDFTTLITDQLQQHAAKFKKMYSDKVTSPVIVRTPMGGKRGYGPTHSQSIESMFYSILGLRIVALNQFIAPQQTIGSLVEVSQEPTLLIENKSLYTQKRITSQIIPGYCIQISDEEFSTVKITPNNIVPQVTILCYGGTVEDVLPAVEQLVKNDMFVEVLIPTSLKPMNIHSIKRSICTSKKLLIVEEGNCHGGILSSVAVKLLQDGVVFSLKSLSSQTILSCAIDAELDSLPNSDDIIMACKELAKI